MTASIVFLGLIDVLINCVVIVLVAVTIVWLLTIVGYPPSTDMVKFGKILVLLLCVAVVAAFLLGLLGGGVSYGPHYFQRR